MNAVFAHARPRLASEESSTVSSRVAEFLTRRRIHISLIVFAIMIAEDVLTGVRPHDLFDIWDGHTVLGLGLVGAGLGLRSWAAGTLTKWAELTTTGPYGLVRHPLYVGSFMMMIGFCEIIDDVENIWVVMGPLLVIYVFAVRREERRLAQRFGGEWDAYASIVPRFLPRRLPGPTAWQWSVGQWLNNREYRAAAASLLGLLLIQLWRFA